MHLAKKKKKIMNNMQVAEKHEKNIETRTFHCTSITAVRPQHH